jgi:hypothetical protein
MAKKKSSSPTWARVVATLLVLGLVASSLFVIGYGGGQEANVEPDIQVQTIELNGETETDVVIEPDSGATPELEGSETTPEDTASLGLEGSTEAQVEAQ